MAAGTRVVTVLFTDLVGSTALARRLDPGAAEELCKAHFAVLGAVVETAGGIVVKSLGDGLMVVFDSPRAALSAAVGMQQAVERANRSAVERLGMRVGIAVGEAAESEGDFFGDPVVEAARLCATAEGGQILAADLVRLMVGRHATQSFVAVGPMELKGLPEPVDVVEVVWEPLTVEGSVPLPGRLVGAASDALFGFFGRAEELDALHEVRKEARASRRCQVVFVAGEAGMGKTSLVAQVARTAHSEGSVVLFGHADEDLGVAYQPWIEVFKTLVRDGDPEAVAALPSAQRGALARLVPEVGADEGRVADPDTERMLLLEAGSELLSGASKPAPVLVVLDDLHWADTATLQLLRHVIASSTPMDVTIVCTYRDTDLTRGDPLTKLLADMRREANVTRVALGGLEDNELVDLIAAAAGHELDDDGVGLAHALRRETDGNPFFTAELLRHLGETGSIVLGEDGRWSLAAELDKIGLPSSVRDVVGRRVERLGEEALRVLCLASVIGREFDVSLLATLADVDEDPLLDLMDAAVVAAVLVESEVGDRYRFAHALIQHSLYDELSPTRRQRAHQRTAEVLESQAATADAATLAELAHHWVAATRPADLDKALGYVWRAGDAARDALAPEDAIRWYQQALDLLARQNPRDDHRRAALLAELGTAERRASQPEGRETLLRAARIAEELDDTDVLVHAALGFSEWASGTVGDDDIKRVAAAALDRIRPDDTVLRARLLAARAGAHDAAIEWQVRRELSLQAIEMARESGDDAAFVDVLDSTFVALATPDQRDQLIEDVSRAVAMADQIGDPVLRARIRFQMVWARYQQADPAGADSVVAEVGDLIEMIGLPYQRWNHAQLVTGGLLRAGLCNEADTANNEALELGMSANAPEALGAFGGYLYAIRQHQGRLNEIADFFIDAAHDNPSIASLRSAVAAMLAELGRIDEAHERLAAEVANGLDFPNDSTWLASMSDLLDTAAICGDRTISATLVDRVAPFAGHVIDVSGSLVRGAIARPLARAATLLGDYDQADAWFATAHDLHGRLQAPFESARGNLDHADLCLARRVDGDVERARSFAASAAAVAAECGYQALATRADILLANV